MKQWLWGLRKRRRRKRRESPAGLLESGAGWRFLWFLRLQLLSVKSSSGKRRRRETDYVRAALPLSHQAGKEDPPCTLSPLPGRRHSTLSSHSTSDPRAPQQLPGAEA